MDIVSFSHLRWNFVYQRPQHLLSRFAKYGRVFYVEEPAYNQDAEGFTTFLNDDNVVVITPHLESGNRDFVVERQQTLIKEIFETYQVSDFVAWYYTPLALAFTSNLKPCAIVYDCMDELSAFRFAPPELLAAESELMERADIVFTGGHSLYEAKKNLHDNIHAFPSSIDKDHFLEGRNALNEPGDQVHIPHPRLGFYGVLDERLDLELLQEIAGKRPLWQLILIGPVAKIDVESLPKNSNIHYLGSKSYDELPAYLSSWDIALLPFALNAATRFISPTKTPEYLMGGKPVISTPVKDVIRFYGENGLVRIAASSDGFIREAEIELNTNDKNLWLKKVDFMLQGNSWDATWQAMNELLQKILENKIVMTT